MQLKGKYARFSLLYGLEMFNISYDTIIGIKHNNNFNKRIFY